MSLEARMELLTAAVIELTAAIGAMQAPGPITISGGLPAEVIKELQQTAQRKEKHATVAAEYKEVVETQTPNDQLSSTDTTSGQQSQPTGESSSQEPTPELDYAKDVKPATLKLSKEKGREVTIAVLARFGVKGAQELDASQWAEYIAHCEKVLAGGEV